MAQAVIMPRQGISVESCILVEFKVKEGDKVSPGDILFVYETDKAVFEEEATSEATVLKILREEGDDVVCLENVLILGEPDEDISEYESALKAPEKEVTPAVNEAQSEDVEKVEAVSMAAAQSAPQEGGLLKISPRAKNLAEKSDADISFAKATGPEGRIIERDVKDLIRNGIKLTGGAAQAKASAVQSTDMGEYEAVKHSNMRKIIAKSMHESLSSMAQLTLNSSFDATNILSFRKVIKAKKESMGINNITVNDMLLYAVSRVILNHPDINAHYMDEEIHRYENVNIGVAVDSERGLLVPTLFGANTLTLDALSSNTKAIIQDARVGKISPDLLSGGTFTVTNLGTLGVESFTPVINPPQTAILGVCNLTTKLKPDGKPYQAMGLSLTFDHRAVDGAPAARFLQDLCGYLENFTQNLALESAAGGLV